MSNTFNVGQLTKEMVTARLKALGDPCEAAAEIAQKTLSVGLKDAPAAERLKLVRDVCRGTMIGLVLAEQSLPKGAIALLGKVAEAATEVQLDPAQAMTAALEGIAGIARVVKENQLYEVRCAVDMAFHGVGEVFQRLIQDAPKEGGVKS